MKPADTAYSKYYAIRDLDGWLIPETFTTSEQDAWTSLCLKMSWNSTLIEGAKHDGYRCITLVPTETTGE